ncbi:MAG: hypothetical protein WKF89_13705 [Chitinophagaceae bacterium]
MKSHCGRKLLNGSPFNTRNTHHNPVKILNTTARRSPETIMVDFRFPSGKKFKYLINHVSSVHIL